MFWVRIDLFWVFRCSIGQFCPMFLFFRTDTTTCTDVQCVGQVAFKLKTDTVLLLHVKSLIMLWSIAAIGLSASLVCWSILVPKHACCVWWIWHEIVIPLYIVFIIKSVHTTGHHTLPPAKLMRLEHPWQTQFGSLGETECCCWGSPYGPWSVENPSWLKDSYMESFFPLQ